MNDNRSILDRLESARELAYRVRSHPTPPKHTELADAIFDVLSLGADVVGKKNDAEARMATLETAVRQVVENDGGCVDGENSRFCKRTDCGYCVLQRFANVADPEEVKP